MNIIRKQIWNNCNLNIEGKSMSCNNDHTRQSNKTFLSFGKKKKSLNGARPGRYGMCGRHDCIPI